MTESRPIARAVSDERPVTCNEKENLAPSEHCKPRNHPKTPVVMLASLGQA